MGKETYTAALIIIGDEILSGRTLDKNTQYIAEKLNEVGVQLAEVRIISDDEAKIVGTVNELCAVHDYIFTTGGIGPTHDDITAESIAKAFGVKLELREDAYQCLVEYYDSEEDITEARKKMAYIPEGGALIPNPVSGAPGIHIGNVYVMAGVPRIMQAMMDHILPTLKGGASVISKTVEADCPESMVAEGLSAINNKYDTVSMGSYPKYQNGRFGTSLVLRSTDEVALDSAVNDVTVMVKEIERRMK